MRFYKSKLYAGYRRKSWSSVLGDYLDSPEVITFRGRPYNPNEYDVIVPLDSNPDTAAEELIGAFPGFEWRPCNRIVRESPIATLRKGENVIGVKI